MYQINPEDFLDKGDFHKVAAHHGVVGAVHAHRPLVSVSLLTGP